jgi:hypothetical protein
MAKHVAITHEMLETYKKYMSQQVGTIKTFQAAATTLSSIITRMLANPNPELMNVVWDFFVEHKTGILLESTALRGVDVLDPSTRFKTEIVYTLFRHAVNGIDVGDSKLIDLQTVQSRLKCPPLIPFLQDKAKTVSATAAQKPK